MTSCSIKMKQRIKHSLSRESLVHLLQDYCGCQCYDSESNAVLAEAVICNVNDGTLVPSTVNKVFDEQSDQVDARDRAEDRRTRRAENGWRDA